MRTKGNDRTLIRSFESRMTVGLTGGIASGKSLVAGELKRLGAHIIDADLISREVVRPGSPAHGETVAAFGPEVLLEDGEIDRKKLGSMVFSDPAKLKRLNAITHPRIRDRIKERVAEIERGILELLSLTREEINSRREEARSASRQYTWKKCAEGHALVLEEARLINADRT